MERTRDRGSAVLRALGGRSNAVRQLLVMWSLATCGVSSLAAQTTTATLQGTVTASDGAVLAGAEVEARSRETGSARAALTDVRGAYRLLGLAPGIYDVTARAVGYRALRRTGVELILGDEATLNFALEPGAVELEPVVVRAGPTLQGERIDVSTPVLEKEIERLPLNTRDVLAVASIAPGVRTFAPEAGRSIPTAGALSTARFVNLYVDGAEWKGIGTGQIVGEPQTGSLIPQEAIREYRVALNPYDAEYGFRATRYSRMASCGMSDPVCGSPTICPVPIPFHSAPSTYRFTKRAVDSAPAVGMDRPASGAKVRTPGAIDATASTSRVLSGRRSISFSSTGVETSIRSPCKVGPARTTTGSSSTAPGSRAKLRVA